MQPDVQVRLYTHTHTHGHTGKSPKRHWHWYTIILEPLLGGLTPAYEDTSISQDTDLPHIFSSRCTLSSPSSSSSSVFLFCSRMRPWWWSRIVSLCQVPRGAPHAPMRQHCAATWCSMESTRGGRMSLSARTQRSLTSPRWFVRWYGCVWFFLFRQHRSTTVNLFRFHCSPTGAHGNMAARQPGKQAGRQEG